MLGETIKIPLSQGRVALVDKLSFGKVFKYKWHADKTSNTYRAKSYNGRKNGKQVPIVMHRLITNAPKGTDVDHINGDGLDNRRSNLRVCTKAENLRNMHARYGTSRYKGVYWQKENNKWRGHIRIDGKLFHLGCFIDESQAAKAYDKAAIEHFGEFANLNFKETG